VREALQQCDALVNSSVIETFGVTLIEAMACGKPVIATRSGGPEDIVKPENGLLVTKDDVPALAQAIIQMAQTYTRYDPQRIRESVTSRYSEAVYVQRLADYYAQASAA